MHLSNLLTTGQDKACRFLPAKEVELLGVLTKNAPNLVKNEAIAREVWGSDGVQVRRRIKYLVFLLRQKLEVEPSKPRLLVSQERVGYFLATER